MVAQRLDAQVQAGDPQSETAVPLRQAAEGAAARRALDHRIRRDAALPAGKRPEIETAWTTSFEKLLAATARLPASNPESIGDIKPRPHFQNSGATATSRQESLINPPNILMSG